MSLKTLKNKLPYTLAGIFILIFFFGLLKNINYVKLPNSDFFQYIDDGHQYLNFKLPGSIHPPPFSPILICLLSKLFPHLQYPELFSAHLINIICASLSLLSIFLIFSKTKPWLGLAVITLTATNKIYITNSLNITNEVIFAFFLSLILLTYSRKHYYLSYFLSGFSFLIRYEAIIIPLAIFAIEFFNKKKKIRPSHLAITFTPIFIWLIILNFHSLGRSIFQNAYINEMIVGKNDIPNPEPFRSLLNIVLSNPIEYLIHVVLFPNKKFNFQPIIQNSKLIFSTIILILCLIQVFSKNKNKTKKIIYLIFPFYLIFTTLFPNFSIRYLFPVFWILYLVIISQKNKLITIFLTTTLLLINLKTMNNYSPYDMVYEKSESRLVVDWVNQQEFDQPTYIITYEPYVMNYFLRPKTYVNLDYWRKNDNNFTKGCNNSTICFLNKISESKPEKSQIILITTSYSSPNNISSLDDQLLVETNHMVLFQDQHLTKEDKKKLKLITELKLKEDNSHWAKIYLYQP